jgi:outer membrane immunogenic protein
MFKQVLISTAALATVLGAAPAMAQDADDKGFSGFYIGGSVGAAVQPNDGAKSSILFDRDLNGSFGDTVTTSTGANAFSTGFCGGAATSSSPVNCTKDKDGIEYMGRVGFDIQRGPIVFGIVGEGGRSEIRDSVSAFSTTPASYTMTRDLRYNAGLRARIGYTPNNSTLFYATGGGAYGKVRNTFSTSNTANSFTVSGNSDAWGYAGGGGVEQKIGRNFSIGLEYLYTDLNDNKGRVRVGAGTAPATNPFLLAGAGGTDFQRSDNRFRWHAMRAVATFRF